MVIEDWSAAESVAWAMAKNMHIKKLSFPSSLYLYLSQLVLGIVYLHAVEVEKALHGVSSQLRPSWPTNK